MPKIRSRFFFKNKENNNTNVEASSLSLFQESVEAFCMLSDILCSGTSPWFQ
jgi:hypothetical protein